MVAAPAPRHTPVLLEEVVAYLRPEAPGLLVDATLGLGGHTRALLERGHPDLRIVGLDRDGESLAIARGRLEAWHDRLSLFHEDFRRGPDLLKAAAGAAACAAGSSTSASAPCTSTLRSGASPSRPTVRWTCAWTGAGA